MKSHKYQVVLLCGPPASGKNTITDYLTASDKKICHFMKHKISVKSIKIKQTSEYIYVDRTRFIELISSGSLIQFHKRYNQFYGVSLKLIEENCRADKISIIHTGRIDDLLELDFELSPNYKILKILLWAKKDILFKRLESRHSTNHDLLKKKIGYLDNELRALHTVNLKKVFDLIIENKNITNTSEKIKRAIYDGLQPHTRPNTDGVNKYLKKKTTKD